MIASDIRNGPRFVTALNNDALQATRLRRTAHPLPAVEAPPEPRSESALVRKLGNFIRLSPGEVNCLADLQSKSKKVASGTDLGHEGQTGHCAHVLQSGWACSYKLLPDGGRQIVSFAVPGDFLGMRSILARAADASFATITDSVVSPVGAAAIFRAFKEYPRLGQALLWAVSRDEAITIEHLVSLGWRSAIERTAHFFLELKDRLWLAGISGEASFECPLNQYLLSDALGITAIHLNRVLRQLREMGLMRVKGSRVVIDDVAGLITLAGYQNAYLDQSGPWVEAAS